MIRIACATNDGVCFTKEHFGSADKYLIFYYHPDQKSFIFEKEVENPHFEEKEDGDPEKAKFVASRLKPLGVNAVMNRAIGKNVVRMRKKFTVIVSREEKILEALKNLNISEVEEENSKAEGEERKIIYVKKESA